MHKSVHYLPAMTLISDRERTFARAISRLANANPFLPERVEAEREALGPDFVEPGAAWHARARPDAYPNLAALDQRASLLAGALRRKLAAGTPAEGAEAPAWPSRPPPPPPPLPPRPPHPHARPHHAHHRPLQHGQGAGGPGHRRRALRALRPRAPRLRRGLHRFLLPPPPGGAARHPGRIRALRASPGRLHRRRAGPRGLARGLPRPRHRLPR